MQNPFFFDKIYFLRIAFLPNYILNPFTFCRYILHTNTYFAFIHFNNAKRMFFTYDDIKPKWFYYRIRKVIYNLGAIPTQED